ncbi:hypothetical protein SEA_EMIANNA_69 [Gordonia phage Emianna]|uniref:DUF7352 domain-containing protein n=2 Tax=Foxborovirus TaxID=2948710 RepID=A0A385UE78_9CAUD|nr:hypothetical protein KNU11_gp70 [Gordonia phage KidneyBean]YP_010098957.1 hypothetical protein KNU15_gp69 [Gordonia phage Emianna]AYD84184.1 hypothetical protein SEA_JIFALL16_69 [Gordonia phage Jifall16]AYD84341.1 hypothetical protein SEA_KURT_69 [Gordonia phage Kurt]QOP66730.1 hypothetical protein SEA_NOVUMREGINA_69 [Gordonia phage NovumRegina]QOR55911.1 hypothetical protein SEA_GROOTJR_71 [Gordonia phage GrootJr]AYB69788.1 hypothetical protein SEA_KIDNEYBEAN_70 [Gordonia phage KidneyBean
MTQTIWKFTIPIEDEVEVAINNAKLLRWLPRGDAFLRHRQADSLIIDEHVIELWAIVELHAGHHERRTVHVRGTGHPLGNVGEYIATLRDGIFVWHVFDRAA